MQNQKDLKTPTIRSHKCGSRQNSSNVSGTRSRMSCRSQFADLEAGEDKPTRKRLCKVFNSPTRPTWSKQQTRSPQVRGPCPVLVLLNLVDKGPRADGSRGNLNGYVSIIFQKEAHDLCEDLKQGIVYDGLQVMKFHWGAMRFSNIDPQSTPKEPVFTAPPVAFVQMVTEACDSTEHCSDWEIRRPQVRRF